MKRALLQKGAHLVPWLAAAGVLAQAWRARGYTADDAFITGRYALRIVAGRGYTFRDGPPTDGVTGPLALAIEVPAAMLGLDPVESAKFVGAASVALAAFLLVRRLLVRGCGRVAAWFALAAIVASSELAMHAQSGLDTGLATLATTVAVLGATARPVAWRRAVTVVAALMPWLRPELVPAAWLCAARALVRGNGTRPSERFVSTAIIGMGLASVVLFRLAMFGDAVPLGVRAKPADLGQGLSYVLVTSAVSFGLMFLPALDAARRSRADRFVGAAFSVGVFAVVLAGGDWMPGGRLLVPFYPVVVGAFAIGAARLAMRFRRRSRSPLPAVLAIALSVCCLLPQISLAPFVLAQADEVRASRQGPGAALRRLLSRSATVALVDVGFLSYRMTFDPFDLAGVTDPAIADRPGGHCAKDVSLDDLLARDVDTLVVHSLVEPRIEAGRVVFMQAHPVERRLLEDPRSADLFEVSAVVRYAERYWYVVLRRRA